MSRVIVWILTSLIGGTPERRRVSRITSKLDFWLSWFRAVQLAGHPHSMVQLVIPPLDAPPHLHYTGSN